MIQFWKDRLLVDQDYFDEIYKLYNKDLYWLWEMFKDNKVVKVQPLSVPNELADYLDGNGFILSFDSGQLAIMSMLDSDYLPLY